MNKTGNIICDTFISECEGRYADIGALSCDVVPAFSKNGTTVEGAEVAFSFSAFTANFIYNVSCGGAKNILEMRIVLHSRPEVDFSLYDLLYLLDENNFKCYIFPYIESSERMKACLKELFSALGAYSVQINAIATDDKLSERAVSRKKKEMRRYFRTDIFNESQDIYDPLLLWQKKCYRQWYVSRFCAKWYRDYILGNYEKAAKSFSKYESKCDYEIRLLRYIKALGSGAENTPVSDGANTFVLWKKAFSHIKMPAFALSCAVLLLPVWLGYMLICLAAYYAIYGNALYSSSLFSTHMIFIPFACALVSVLFISDILFYKFIPKSKRNIFEQTGMNDIPDEDAHSSRFSVNFVVVLSLVAVIFAAKWGVAVYPSGMTDNSGIFSKINESFSDVQSASDNGRGYTITFKDGVKMNFSYEAGDKYILPRINIIPDRT